VPSSRADGAGGAPPLGATPLDHFACYDATVAKAPRGEPPLPEFTEVRVAVADGFGETRLYDLTKPTKLCNPADKNGEDPSAPSHPGLLVCYRGTLAKTKPAQPGFANHVLSTRNQFGDEVLKVTAATELCLPSVRLE
jgi:hypothetical protein